MSADTTTTVTELPTRGRYRIAPTTSTARFTVDMVFGLITSRGEIPIRAGSVEITDGSARVTAELDPAAIATGNRRRDKDLRSARFLDVDRFPAVRFVGTVPPDLTAAPGSLTMHGDTVATTVDIRAVRRTDNRIDVVATARLDRFAFGVTAARRLVGRHVNVALAVTLLTDDTTDEEGNR